MAVQRISEKAIQEIKDNEELWRAVADAIGVKTRALQSYLDRKSKRLIETPVVDMIIEFTGLSKSDVLEKVELSENADEVIAG